MWCAISDKNLRDKLLILSFFIVFPFEMVNHSLVYSLMELLVLNSVFFSGTVLKFALRDIFFRSYLIVILWCLVVTLLSPVPKVSLKGSSEWTLPLLMFLGLYSISDLQNILARYLWIPTLIVLVQSIVLFIYFKFGLAVIDNHNVLRFIYFLNWEWPGKVYSSTISLCLIVLICVCCKNKMTKISLCAINVVAGIISYNRAFVFSLILMALLYLYLNIRSEKINRIKNKLIIFAVIVFIALIFIANNLLGINLHIIERVAVYDYWLPKLWLSPFYGIGVGLNSLQYYLKIYPIPGYLFSIDEGMRVHSHNLFIDIALTQGFIGLGVFLWCIGTLIYVTIRSSNAKQRYTFLFMVVAIFSKFMFDDVIEGHKLVVFWFFLIVAYLISMLDYYLQKRVYPVGVEKLL
jgi:hypothetical protein